MVSNLFADNRLSSAVRRPLSAVGFGSSGADVWRGVVASVVVEAGTAPFVDVADLYLAGGASAPDVAREDTGTIELGYEDSATETAFTGRVEEIRHSVRQTARVTAVNGGALLSRLRVNQGYEQQTAGDIVRDLAKRAAVETGTVDDGISFPFYVVDDGRSAYQHVAALAAKSGFLARFTPEGRLDFAPPAAGQPVQAFTYGEDLVWLQVADAAPVVGSVVTVGEGAAGSEGQEAWSWLVKDPSPLMGSAGAGAPVREVQDPSLRSGEAAQSAADAIASAAGRTALTGRALVPGSPAVVAGSTIEIAEAPRDALNGVFLVRRVRHRLSKEEGFTTLICFGKVGDDGLGGLP